MNSLSLHPDLSQQSLKFDICLQPCQLHDLNILGSPSYCIPVRYRKGVIVKALLVLWPFDVIPAPGFQLSTCDYLIKQSLIDCNQLCCLFQLIVYSCLQAALKTSFERIIVDIQSRYLVGCAHCIFFFNFCKLLNSVSTFFLVYSMYMFIWFILV